MPIPKNWVEELCVEWLSIKGYLTQSNVRLKDGVKGSVSEADVIGARINGNKLEIFHIESGSLVKSFTANLKAVKDKFSGIKTDAVTSIVKSIIQWDGAVNYKKMYVASYPFKVDNLLRDLQLEQTEIFTLKEFVENDVLKAIHQWKDNQGRKTTDHKLLTLPECNWLLDIIDFIHNTDTNLASNKQKVAIKTA